jgi:hypothetical protein
MAAPVPEIMDRNSILEIIDRLGFISEINIFGG